MQFGDTAFEKEEIFVTFEGLNKLKASRISSLHVLDCVWCDVEIKTSLLANVEYIHSEFDADDDSVIRSRMYSVGAIDIQYFLTR